MRQDFDNIPCFVYWIKLPSQTDVLNEGYIGITTTSVYARYASHKTASKSCDNIIHRAIRKYGNQLEIVTLIEGSLKYCLLIENKLRPSKYTGWNSAVGGEYGTKHSKESIEHMSVVQKECWKDPVRRKKFSDKKKGIAPSDKTRLAQIKSQKLLCSWERSRTDSSIWSRADEFYGYWKLVGCSTRELQTVFGLPRSKFLVMHKKFKQNWIPHEDPQWLSWKSSIDKE